MSEKPKVSFLIPCFNGERYIAESLKSACEQNFHSYEVIVINDGSKDNSEQVIRHMRERFCFRYIKQENKGVCSALNAGLSVARGDYLCWGGHDDIYHRHRLSYQVEFLDRNPDYGACYSNVEYIDLDGVGFGYGKRKNFKSGYVLKELFYRNFIPAPASMVRTNIVRELGGFDAKYLFEDYPLWLAVAERYPIGFVDSVVTRYRLHDGNMSGNNERFYVGTQEILEDWSGHPECRKALRYWYRRWFCDASKGPHVWLTERYLNKLRLVDFVRPRVIRSYARYLRQKKLFGNVSVRETAEDLSRRQ